MSGTDGDGYQSAWRADHARDLPTGDPWGAPMSRSTVPDAASPGVPDGTAKPGDETAAVGSLDPSTSEHPTAPWPFVTSRAAFPDAEFSPADDLPIAAGFPDVAELPDAAEFPDVAGFPDAAGAPPPPWPGDLDEPMPSAVWPPTDLPHESPSGVWTPPAPGGHTTPPYLAQPAPPAWPQQSAPPSWPPLPDTSAGEGAASILERRAPSSEVRPSAPESASAVPGPSGWAYATDVAAAGVYVPGAPPPWPEHRAQSAPPSVSPSVSAVVSQAWPQSMASGTTGYGLGGGGSGDRGTGRSRRRGVIALVVVIAVVVFSVVGVAIGTRSHGHAGAKTTSAAGPSAGTSVGPVPAGSTSAGSTVDAVPLGDGPALIRKIVPAPTGAHVYDVDDSTAGVMDLDQYARHYFNGRRDRAESAA